MMFDIFIWQMKWNEMKWNETTFLSMLLSSVDTNINYHTSLFSVDSNIN